MPLPSSRTVCFLLFSLSLLLVGCGSSNMVRIPPPPTFTSMPLTVAVEGQQYTYQIAATSSDGSTITFSLMTGPAGATLSGNTISWTPTHAESRTSNAFTVVATTSAGGSAPQSWTVTPNGTVNITSVTTFWTPSGQTNITNRFPANLPFPAALIPQSDGSLQRLQGATNPDGSFSIPNVPAGTYLLQIGPNANYWTPASDFDDGFDVVGRPLSTTSESTTTFSSSIVGLNPPSANGDVFFARTDLDDFFSPAAGFVAPGSSSFNGIALVKSNIDFSKITTLFVGQYMRTATGNFTGYLLGPSLTLSNVSFTNGATNLIDATLSQSPAASLSLAVAGTAWAALASTAGPGTPTPAFSDYAAFVQPFVTDRLARPTPTFLVGPDLPLIRPAAPPSNTFPAPSLYACGSSIFATSNLPSFGIAPIVSDMNFGTLSYGDPYPSNLPRIFQYCQFSIVSLPRPNSSVTDTFFVPNTQATALPTSAVTPILSNVQAPMLNNGSLFNSATLNTTTLNISWTAPATGTPYGYFVRVFQLQTLPSGSQGYALAGIYGTAQTSMTIPFISANSTYVFAIIAASDASANIQTSPHRNKLPTAESVVLSAPFVIAPGATATVATAP